MRSSDPGKRALPHSGAEEISCNASQCGTNPCPYTATAHVRTLLRSLLADLHEVMFATKRAMLAQFLERVTIDLATAITGCTTRSAVQPG